MNYVATTPSGYKVAIWLLEPMSTCSCPSCEAEPYTCIVHVDHSGKSRTIKLALTKDEIMEELDSLDVPAPYYL